MKKEALKESAKLIIDIGKLGLGGIIFASIIKSDDVDKNLLVAITILVVVLMFIIGLYLFNKGSKE
jgi:hypothetical protein